MAGWRRASCYSAEAAREAACGQLLEKPESASMRAADHSQGPGAVALRRLSGWPSKQQLESPAVPFWPEWRHKRALRVCKPSVQVGQDGAVECAASRSMLLPGGKSGGQVARVSHRAGATAPATDQVRPLALLSWAAASGAGLRQATSFAGYQVRGLSDSSVLAHAGCPELSMGRQAQAPPSCTSLLVAGSCDV